MTCRVRGGDAIDYANETDSPNLQFFVHFIIGIEIFGDSELERVTKVDNMALTESSRVTLQ